MNYFIGSVLMISLCNSKTIDRKRYPAEPLDIISTVLVKSAKGSEIMPKHRKDGNGTKERKYKAHFAKIIDKTSKGKTNKKHRNG